MSLLRWTVILPAEADGRPVRSSSWSPGYLPPAGMNLRHHRRMIPDRLGTRALNRALLARQHLLERATLPPLAMLEHLVATPAQNPLDPYLALWTRLQAFDPATLSAHIEGREAVRMGLLRTTLHLVSAADAPVLWPLLQPVLARA